MYLLFLSFAELHNTTYWIDLTSFQFIAAIHVTCLKVLVLFRCNFDIYWMVKLLNFFVHAYIQHVISLIKHLILCDSLHFILPGLGIWFKFYYINSFHASIWKYLLFFMWSIWFHREYMYACKCILIPGIFHQIQLFYLTFFFG